MATPDRCRECGHEALDHEPRVHEETTYHHIVVTKKSMPCFARVSTTNGDGYCSCWDYR